jgi:hypothetical protein
MPDLYDPSDPVTRAALGRLEPARLSGYLAGHGWHLLEASHDTEYWTQPDDGHIQVELPVPTQAVDVQQWPQWWAQRAGEPVYSLNLAEDRPMQEVYADLTGSTSMSDRVTNPSDPTATQRVPAATCQGCGLPIYRRADGTWDLVYREWDNTRICWPNNAGDHQPAASLPGGPPA